MAATSPLDNWVLPFRQNLNRLEQLLQAHDRQIEFLATSMPDDPDKYGPQLDNFLQKRKRLMGNIDQTLTDANRCLAELFQQEAL